MGPKVDKTRKKSAADDDTGEAEDIVLRVMEALTDERIAKQLRKMLLPHALMEKINEMDRNINTITARLEAKDTKIAELETKLTALETSVDDMEQYTRRSNLVFSGFAESARGEDTDAKIMALVNDEMDLAPPLQPADIARSHRLGAPRPDGRNRPIIVRFRSDRVRDTVYRARIKLKDLNRRNRETPVFVNDDLTSRRSKLAFECRKLKKGKKITDTWTFNGKVLVKDLANKVIQINGLEQLRNY